MNKSFLHKILFLVCCGGLVFSCREQVEPLPTLYDAIVQEEETTLFIEALDRTGLAEDLQGSDANTVFVPTDEAMVDYLSAVNCPDLEDMPVDELRGLLLYHMLLEPISMDNFSDKYLYFNYGSRFLKTRANIGPNGEYLSCKIRKPWVEANSWINDDTRIIRQDLEASNGNYNLIAKVQDIPTVLSVLGDNEEYEEYLEGVHLIEGLAETLASEKESITVLAPDGSDDRYFLAPLFGVFSFRDLELAKTDSIIKYHILNGNFNFDRQEQIMGEVFQTFLENKSLTLAELYGHSLNVDYHQSNFVSVNQFQALNGSVYRISRILLP